IGFDVLATVRRDSDADALAAHDDSGHLRPVMLDVTDQASIEAATRTVEEWAPDGLAGLVNNAGIAVSGPLELVPIDELRQQLEVNLVGHVAVTQAMAPLLR